MKPTTFGQRLGAYIIDAIVLFPIGLLSIGATYVAPQFGVILHLMLAPTACIYAVFFISKRGQTIGKRVLKVKVVRLDGGDVGMREAVLRSLIDLFFAAALGISSFVASMAMLEQQSLSDKAFELKDAVQLLNAGQSDGVGQMISIATVFYMIAQLICFFSNPERRFIHDLVAATKVVKIESQLHDAANAAN